MKKSNLFIASLCTVVMGLGFAATSFGGASGGSGIVDSKHDMRAYAGANGGVVDAQQRVCAYCHTPHHALEDFSADYMPLWSRTLTTESFIGYDSSTFDGYDINNDPVAGPSRLCMGCHDGAVAIDAYYGAAGTATLIEGDAWGEIGVGLNGDLSNDHPIGFDYTAVAGAVDSEIKLATAAVFAGAAQNATVADLLYDGTIMTCATCHDVHNGPSVATGEGYFLYGKQEDSAFCTTCHIK